MRIPRFPRALFQRYEHEAVCVVMDDFDALSKGRIINGPIESLEFSTKCELLFAFVEFPSKTEMRKRCCMRILTRCGKLALYILSKEELRGYVKLSAGRISSEGPRHLSTHLHQRASLTQRSVSDVLLGPDR